MSITDYSNLEKAIKDAPEARSLPRGTEVEFRIINVTSGEGDYGVWHRVSYDVPNRPEALEFSDFFTDPKSAAEDDDLKRRARAYKKFDTFAMCIGLDYSRPFSWEDDLIGRKGWAILGVKKSDEYGDQNTISKYLARK